MAIVKWNPMRTMDPWEDMRNLQNEINRLFDFDSFPAGTGLFDRSVSPAVDVNETEDDFIVTAELPGMKEDDISLSITGNVLTLTGEKKAEANEGGGKYYKRETWSGSFQRTLSFPSSVDSGKISAELADGILTVTVPKREEEKPKQISVNIK